MKILICFGTRPEYIKVKSLIKNLDNIKTCYIKQHKDLLSNIKTDYIINISELTDNRLNNIISNILCKDNIFNDIDYVLVQGDTTSALSIALSAFNNNKKVIHLEAGLRSYNKLDPYPEEMNRCLISRITDIHLCPTELNKMNLIKENIKDNIYVVGNTGLDNINRDNIKYGNKILITLHRRDNHNMMDLWFKELEKIANKYNEIEFILPIHPNPNVLKHKNILKKVNVIEPLNHNNLIDLIKECKFIISDSGGIQEECSFLKKKIVICRKTTERPEVLENYGVLCDSIDKLENYVDEFMNNYEIDKECPFGDGYSWIKIKKILC
jgi:UDP-N-acetylglucosamine 2-epimerase (non-hydrolysing)